MMDYRATAIKFLQQIELPLKGGDPTVLATCATANAVLALLDYLQQDDEPEPAAYRKDRENLIHIIEVRDAQIRNLKEALQDSHAALRARDDELNTEMKANKDE